jgi:hypothetical protein
MTTKSKRVLGYTLDAITFSGISTAVLSFLGFLK